MGKLHVYKYQGAGNDFVIVDNRRGEAEFLTPHLINRLCDRRFGVGADGLMTLCASDVADFEMHYYNSDGPEGTMCGNGGRCLVAFADTMGISKFEFLACDGYHRAEVLERAGDRRIVRLKMRDVDPVVRMADGWLLETGSTHFIQWVKDLEHFDVDGEGKRLRWDARFPNGANVNFVEPFSDHLAVRTYERGVEAETWACGTGSTAAALASYVHGEKCFVSKVENDEERIKFAVQTRGGRLEVDFIAREDGSFRDVWLTGPATRVFETDIDPEQI
ncbi:MAG: diaminopimelate epimerase [Bacteroidales bacterium]|nr:diaminopimelate epimerase [Bacteroidales bacterium]